MLQLRQLRCCILHVNMRQPDVFWHNNLSSRSCMCGASSDQTLSFMHHSQVYIRSSNYAQPCIDNACQRQGNLCSDWTGPSKIRIDMTGSDMVELWKLLNQYTRAQSSVPSLDARILFRLCPRHDHQTCSVQFLLLTWLLSRTTLATPNFANIARKMAQQRQIL